MRLGASLRDRATLPSPLRGLGPSGGYPSRLRSLRSLRAPLARRLAALTAVAGPARSRRGSTASSAGPPRSPRAGAARRARRGTSPRSPSPAAPAAGLDSARRGCTPCLAGAGCASHRLRHCAVHEPPSPVSPLVRALLRSATRTSLRTAPCSGARTGAGTSASASGSVLRTTACGSRRTARRSRAAAAPLRGLRPRRFPRRSCSALAVPDRPGRPWFSHPTHRWCLVLKAAHAAPLAVTVLTVRSPARPCRAGNGDTNLVAHPLRMTTPVPLRLVVSAPGHALARFRSSYQNGGTHHCAQL